MPERPGRPRSSQAHRAILQATRDLLVVEGYDRLSIDAIAARAGVAKQTVYRRWPSKAPVVVAAVLDGYAATGPPHLPDTGDVLADLRGWLHDQVTRLNDSQQVAVSRALAAAAANDEVDAAQLYEHLTGPWRDEMAQRLRAGVETGQLRPDLQLDAAIDAIIGTLLYHALARRDSLTHERADGLIDLLATGMTGPA